MKVFISSVVSGMEPYRDAAAKAARMLKHEVLRSEDFGASPGTPQRVCLAAVRAADVVLLLLGKRYGTPQGSGLSPTHEEFREAKDRCRVLVFVENLTDREPDQSRFLEEAQAWGAGLYTSAFSTPDELQEAIVGAVHQLELSVRTGPVDADEMVSRGREALASGSKRQDSPAFGWRSSAPHCNRSFGRWRSKARTSAVSSLKLSCSVNFKSSPRSGEPIGESRMIDSRSLKTIDR